MVFLPLLWTSVKVLHFNILFGFQRTEEELLSPRDKELSHPNLVRRIIKNTWENVKHVSSITSTSAVTSVNHFTESPDSVSVCQQYNCVVFRVKCNHSTWVLLDYLAVCVCAFDLNSWIVQLIHINVGFLDCGPSGVPNGQWMKIPNPGKLSV